MCSKDKFENCDPETKEEDFCLFHKPKKTQEEAEKFYSKLRELIERGNTNFSGFVFPPMNCEDINFKELLGVEVNQPFKFQSTKFEANADFSQINFKKKAYFYGSIFEKNANFSYVTFYASAVFSFSEFNGHGQFFRSEFRDGVTFAGTTELKTKFKTPSNFSKCYFKGDYRFDEVIFEDNVDFSNSTFGKHSPKYFYSPNVFENAEFKGDTNFSKCIFKECIIFKKTKFNKVNFTDAKFMDEVSFLGAEFEEEALFVDVAFKKGGSFSGEYGTEGKLVSIFKDKANFDNSTFGKGRAWFEDVEFGGDTSFRSCTFESMANFKRTIFKRSLSFGGADFKKTLEIFEGNTEKDIKEGFKKWLGSPNSKIERSLNSKIEVCDIYFKYLDQIKEKEKADIVFVIQKRAEREYRVEKSNSYLNKLINKISGWIEQILIDWSCEYGTNWKRVLSIWGILIVVLSIFFYGHIMVEQGKIIKNIWTSLYFSIVTVTTLGYGDFKPTPGWGRILAAFGAIAGSYLWVVLITVLSRKYMRK